MSAQDDFKLEWHGSCVVITPAADAEKLSWSLVEQAAEIVMTPLRSVTAPTVIFDLTNVRTFGSLFLSLLLRCHKLAKTRGGELVLSGVSPDAAELLRLTALDTIWAIYETPREALSALQT